MRAAVRLVWALVLIACAGRDDSMSSGVSSLDAIVEQEPAAAWGRTVPTAIEDVWIFNHESSWGEQARFHGAAEIKDGCLLVNDVVVIWDRSRVTVASELVDAALSVQSREVSLVGGHTEQVPSEVAARCNVGSVFLNSAESAY